MRAKFINEWMSSEHDSLIDDVRQGLQQFVLKYHPKVNIRSLNIDGFLKLIEFDEDEYDNIPSQIISKNIWNEWEDQIMDSGSINEYSNAWAKTDKGGEALLAYEEKVLNILLRDMEEDQAYAALEVPFIGEMLAKAAQRRKDPERFARQIIRMAQDEWIRNAEN